MRRTVVLIAVTAAVAAFMPGLPSVNALTVHPDADTVYSADFEGFPLGTEITDQYPFVSFDSFGVTGDGFTYGTPDPANDVVLASGNPLTVNDNAHSGSSAGEVECGAEFCTAGVFGLLNYAADAISVYVGDSVTSGVKVQLDAYDANKNYLTSASVTSSGVGAQTLLNYTAPAGKDIAYFDLYLVGTGNETYLDLDDLSISVPAGSVPTVGVSAPASSYEIGQDGTIEIPLTIHRINGATGDVDLDVEGFTSHVTGSATDPGTGNTSTLTISADHTAPATTVPITITASATDTNSQPPLTIDVQPIPPISFAAPTKVKSQTCQSNTFTVEAQVAPGEPGSSVAFSTAFAPSTTGLTASATTPIAISSGLADSSVHVVSTGDGVPTDLIVTAQLSNGDSSSWGTAIERDPPSITSVDAIDKSANGTPVGGTQATTPRAGQNGTTLEIYGHGFCDTATVFVGNDQAGVSATVQHKSNNQGPYDYIRITTPRLATTGKVSVQTGSPSATSAASSTALSVDSYRNTNAWSFHNFNPNLTFDDLTQAFGQDQTYLHVDPCGALSLGAVHCSAYIVQDPTAYALLGIAQASMENGTCFGLALSTQRILEGIDTLPGNPKNIFAVPEPNIDHDLQAIHGKQPVLDLLKADHLMQLSDQFIEQWSTASTALWLAGLNNASTVNTTLANDIAAVFSKGRYPLISMQDQSGHVVVAYDLEQTGPGTYDVYVYDSNDEFVPSEDSDAGQHQANVDNAVIHLAANGDWSLASTPENDDVTPWHGGPGGLVVTDPAIIPKVPSLASFSGAAPPGVLFSSNSSPSSTSKGSSAAITQVSSGGRTLFTSGGALNSNAATRLEAAPLGPFVSNPAAKTTLGEHGELIGIAKSVHNINVTTTGAKNGPATLTYVQKGYAGEVHTTAATGLQQAGTFNSKSGTVGFAGTSSHPVTLDVTRSTKSDTHDVTVSLAKPGSADTLTLSGGKGAVTLSHTGGATTFSITLSGSQPKGLPQTFTSKSIKIGAGKSAHISGISWGHADGTVTVRVDGKSIVLHNLTKAAHGVKLTHVHVSRKGAHTLDAVLNAKLPALPKGSQAFAVWLVRFGHKLLATHQVALRNATRSITSKWLINLAKHKKWRHKRLTFTASVIAIAVHAGNETTAVGHRTTRYRVT